MSKVQPIPIYIHPNISGNVESVSNKDIASPIANATTASSVPYSISTAPSQSSFSLFWILLIIFFVAALVFILSKRKSEN